MCVIRVTRVCVRPQCVALERVQVQASGNPGFKSLVCHLLFPLFLDGKVTLIFIQQIIIQQIFIETQLYFGKLITLHLQYVSFNKY